MSPERTAPPTRSIRRYENRKLYDPEAGRYVTLEDVGRMVAGGADVEVVDQKTGEDLTSFTLAQVLLERVRTGASRIPRQVLGRLIRVAAGPSSRWGYWPEPQDIAARARQEAERIVSRVLGQGRLSLDEAVALRQDVAQVVHRLVAEAQAGVESSLRGLLERGEGVAGRSLEALRGGLEAFGAYIEKPAAPARRAGLRTGSPGRARRTGDRAPRRAAAPRAAAANSGPGGSASELPALAGRSPGHASLEGPKRRTNAKRTKTKSSKSKGRHS